MLLARLQLGLVPRDIGGEVAGTSRYQTPLAAAWITARQILEIATRGGAAVLGRDDIGALAKGKCADFFSLALNTVDYAGGLSDPVAATLFCAPQKASYTVIGGKVVVKEGIVVTVDMGPVVEAHNRFSLELANSR